MLYSHQGKIINTEEVEFLLVGKDSATVYMTNGARHPFLSGAEDLIDTFMDIPHVTIGNKIFLAQSISTVNCSATMATIEMKSGYRETVTGEERVRALLEEVDCTVAVGASGPIVTAEATPQSYRTMTETEAPKGGTRRRNLRGNGGV